jgi:anti-sigma28 factor (negative regulator of flagellin synthesis)
MSIRSIGSQYTAQRPAAPSPAAPAAPAEKAEKVKAGGPPPHAKAHGFRARQDSVAISDDARALAARGAEDAGAPAAAAGPRAARAPLSAERVQELRKKVLEGAYDQAHVVDQVAKRLLASGDV